jgi:hypothetical protein
MRSNSPNPLKEGVWTMLFKKYSLLTGFGCLKCRTDFKLLNCKSPL